MILNFLKKNYYKKYSKISYSISNVDLIIDRMFIKKKSGTFIDLGCNHPIKFNNTYLLYKRGWRGVNIDLDETSIKEFNNFSSTKPFFIRFCDVRISSSFAVIYFNSILPSYNGESFPYILPPLGKSTISLANFCVCSSYIVIH